MGAKGGSEALMAGGARGARAPTRGGTAAPGNHLRTPDSIEGTVLPVPSVLHLGRARSGCGTSYGSWTSLVPFASDVAADLKAFVRSADAPAVFGTQK